MHLCCEDERRRDGLYCMLVDDTHDVRSKLVLGIHKLVRSQSTHPAMSSMCAARTPLLDKAVLLAALAIEPDFFGYMAKLDHVCASAVSELVANVMPGLLQSVLDGNMSIPKFVSEGTRAYVRL
jgi:hypothetical protein